MDQKWQTTINWMSDVDMRAVLRAHGFEKYPWSNLRESLRLRVLNKEIPTEALADYLTEDKYISENPNRNSQP